MTRTSACESPKGWRLDTRTGERYPVPCGRLSCSWCGPVTALATVSAIRISGFDRSGILSVTSPESVGEGEARAAGKVIRTLMGRLVDEVRSMSYAWEHVAVVEISPSDRPHMHFLQRGDEVPSDVMLVASRSVGAGWVGMDAVRHPPTIARYVLKGGLRRTRPPSAGGGSGHGPALRAERMASRELDAAVLARLGRTTTPRRPSRPSGGARGVETGRGALSHADPIDRRNGRKWS